MIGLGSDKNIFAEVIYLGVVVYVNFKISSLGSFQLLIGR